MKVYTELCLQGEKTIPERKIFLAQKREELLRRMSDLQASVDFIDWKQGFYDDVLSGKTEYYSVEVQYIGNSKGRKENPTVVR